MDARALALAPSALFPTPVLSSACAARVSPANGARRSRTSAIPPIRASAQAENQPSAHPSTSATPPSAASAASPEALPRRSALAGGLLALASATLSPYLPLPALPPVAHAAADAAATVEAAGGSDLLKGLRSAFDSEEITASGRRLPKAYVRSVTALISSLRDALGAEEGDRGEFRRKADVAKGAIRAYLGEWRGKAPENTEGRVEQGEGGTREGLKGEMAELLFTHLMGSGERRSLGSRLYGVPPPLLPSSPPPLLLSSPPPPPNQINTSALNFAKNVFLLLTCTVETLSRFYMRSGVNAKLPADVRDGILADLALAEAAL
ncbi:unnamed protein product [Closterium sp. Naga37s-1]|nr:unnamed protein product [Closterium sp. Naga37s-1]